jgi:hypothetical protein
MKYPSLLLLIIISVFLFLGCPPNETQYHVYYHGNGATDGKPPVDSKEYFSGETADILEKGDLKKGDYDFLGWRDRDYDRTYFAGDSITVWYNDVNLYAVWDDGSDPTFNYVIEENGEVTITRYNKQYASFITIPDTLKSKPVTAIDDAVFSNLSIASINLPKNLKRIGVIAFASNDIFQLIIPDKVEYIGLGAFRDNKLKNITLGTGISAIEPYTFSNNQLKDITIPENVASIGTGAFHENDIEFIKIGAGVDIKNDTSLGTYGMSFRAYYNLEKKAGLYIYTGNDVWERY